MRRHETLNRALLVLMLLSMLTACSTSPVVTPTKTGPTATDNMSTTQPPTSTPAVATQIPATATLLPTETATPYLTPTLVVLAPNYYAIDQCKGKSDDYMGIRFCIVGIEIKSNHHMVFNVSWQVRWKQPGVSHIRKRSDEGNKNMFVTDNFNNRYEVINGGGTAFQTVEFEGDKPLYGWFEFNAPPPGALVFAFHDDDNGFFFGGLSLDTAPIPYEKLTLSNPAYVLKFSTDEWKKSTDTAGLEILESQKIPGCTLQSVPSQDPTGNLKNTVKLNGIDVQIWGYYNQEKNISIREYVAIGGLKDLTLKNTLMFQVILPPDKATECGTSVGNTLGGIELAEQ